MADGDRKLWLEGTDSKIKKLEEMDCCWDVIAWSEATSQASCAIGAGTQM